GGGRGGVGMGMGGVWNEGGTGAGDVIEQAPLVGRAAQVDAVGIAVGPKLLAPQLAPIGVSIQTTAQTAAGASKLAGGGVGDLVGIHDQRGSRRPGGGVTQVEVSKVRDLKVEYVKPPTAQDPVQRLLQPWYGDAQTLEAAGRGQRPDLQ